jgi:hypothetical protein
VREIEDATRIAERSGDDFALTLAQIALGFALVHRQTAAERDRGQKLLAEVSEVFLRRGHHLCDLPIVKVYLARERARCGDHDDAIPLMRTAIDHLFREGQPRRQMGLYGNCEAFEITSLMRSSASPVSPSRTAVTTKPPASSARQRPSGKASAWSAPDRPSRTSSLGGGAAKRHGSGEL